MSKDFRIVCFTVGEFDGIPSKLLYTNDEAWDLMKILKKNDPFNSYYVYHKDKVEAEKIRRRKKK